MKRIIGILMLASLTASCAMLRSGNPATTAGASYGPCGSWVDCGQDQPKKDRCCPPTTACAADDGGLYCAADEAYDPSDPVTWGKRTGKQVHILRSATGE